MSNRAARLRAFHQEAGACTKCHEAGLLHVESPHQRARPLFQKNPTCVSGVMVVAEAPNWDDTYDPNKGFLTYEADTDPTGSFTVELLASVGLKPEDVLFSNAVLCLPARKGERHPVSAPQRNACRPWLKRLVEAADPLVVVTLGAQALMALGRLEPHGLTPRTGVGKLHRWMDRYLLPLYHPGRLGRIARPAAQQFQDIAVLKQVLTGCADSAPATSARGGGTQET
jgi:uracil-DNA glycosylase family 4